MTATPIQTRWYRQGYQDGVREAEARTIDLPSVNMDKRGGPINYCPECGREEYVLGLDNATIERCAQWHDKQEQMMVEAGDLIAAEWHRDSAAAIRALRGEP